MHSDAKRLRVMIAASRPPRVDGELAAAMAEELVRRGHVVRVLQPGPRSKGCDVDGNPSLSVWPSRRPVGWRDALFLDAQLREFRPSHVIANFGSVNLVMILGYLRRVSRRVSWYHTVSSAIDREWRGARWRRATLRLRKRIVYATATHLLAPSAAAANDLIQTFAVSPRKVVTFPNAMSDVVPNLGAFRVPGRVVCVGRLVSTKGQDVLIRAAGMLAREFPQLEVRFVGSGPDHHDLRVLAEECGVGEMCTFLGGVSRAEVLRELSQAEVSVVPSREEAFGMVVVESLAVATPLVAARVGGIPEIVRDGREGLLFTREEPAELAARLRRLLSEPVLRQELARNARRRFLDTYESVAAVKRQCDWLESL